MISARDLLSQSVSAVSETFFYFISSKGHHRSDFENFRNLHSRTLSIRFLLIIDTHTHIILIYLNTQKSIRERSSIMSNFDMSFVTTADRFYQLFFLLRSLAAIHLIHVCIFFLFFFFLRDHNSMH
jgi:hypothetical protein